MASLHVAILGAESTGKTTLARAIVAQWIAEKKHAVLVPEYLREWCDIHDRTPLKHDQANIAWTQAQRAIDAQSVAPQGGLVVADTTPLMTAVYSDIYFNDTSLYPYALEHQRHYGLTLLNGMDIAWVADGIQRDSEVMRKAVDRRLREVLTKNGITFATVYGRGQARTDCALQTIACGRSTPRTGNTSAWKWTCEKCSDADCEQRLFSHMRL